MDVSLRELLALILSASAILYYIGVIVFIIGDDRSTDTTMTWLIVLLFLPFTGIVLYYFLGKNYRNETSPLRRKMRAAQKKREKIFPEAHASYETFSKQFRETTSDPDIVTTSQLIERNNDCYVLPAEKVKLLEDGKEFFDELKRQLSSAKQYIHMMYFIWEKDELTRELTDILLAKLRDGVEVRLLYDALGSIMYGKSELKELKAAGAHIAADNTAIYLLNFRNHHKITVVDGRVSFTGGHNIGQEYIDGGKNYKSWRDSSIEITGPALLDLQDIFALRWLLKTGEDIYDEKYFPSIPIPAKPIAVQMAYSSIDLKWETVKQVYLKLILSANERVYIQTPYFIPDQTLLDALIAAGLSGVDVQLMMTGVPDKNVPWWAGKAYFKKPLEAGVKIFFYDTGFFHVKTLLIDDTVVSVGTVNFDMRSFNLQKENTCLVYDAKTVQSHLATYRNDLKSCSTFTLSDFQALHPLAKLRNALCKVPSRLF